MCVTEVAMLLRMLSDILLVLIICKHQAHHYLHRYRISVFLLVALTIIAEGVVVGGEIVAAGPQCSSDWASTGCFTS